MSSGGYGYDPRYGYPPPPSPAAAPPSPTPPAVPWTTKLGYVGLGVVVGVIVAPAARKALENLRPKLDGWLERITGSAERLAESAGDFMAAARHQVRDEAGAHEGHHHHDAEPKPGA